MSNELRDTIAQAIYNYSQEPPLEELRDQFPVTAWDELLDIVKAAPRGYADAVLAALQTAGYTIVRPVTAEEEAANVW